MTAIHYGHLRLHSMVIYDRHPFYGHLWPPSILWSFMTAIHYGHLWPPSVISHLWPPLTLWSFMTATHSMVIYDRHPFYGHLWPSSILWSFMTAIHSMVIYDRHPLWSFRPPSIMVIYDRHPLWSFMTAIHYLVRHPYTTRYGHLGRHPYYQHHYPFKQRTNNKIF